MAPKAGGILGILIALSCVEAQSPGCRHTQSTPKTDVRDRSAEFLVKGWTVNVFGFGATGVSVTPCPTAATGSV